MTPRDLFACTVSLIIGAAIGLTPGLAANHKRHERVQLELRQSDAGAACCFQLRPGQECAQ